MQAENLYRRQKQRSCNRFEREKNKKPFHRASTHLLFNDRRQRQVIEQISEHRPDVSIAVLSDALVIKPVTVQSTSVSGNKLVTSFGRYCCDLHLCDLSALVVATQYVHAVGVPHFQTNEQRNSLHLQFACHITQTHSQEIGTDV